MKVVTFNELGLCNYCEYYDSVILSVGSKTEREQWLKNKVEEIKKKGKKSKYDCIIGISGGVDSSYLALWAVENGLRPLVVHFDNGWNSELATENITQICAKLNLELSTIVINWDEFKELQLSYFRAGVVDIEALTDHAIYATVLEIAKKNRIRFTLNGFNFATEAIMPIGWVFNKNDWANIKDIYQKFGSGKSLKSYPHVSFLRKLYYHWFLRLESIQALNYIQYNKEEAKERITKILGWRDYGGKHYESVFTKFYQAYILPRRFGIDKRYAHLSNLICSGQITRVIARMELAKPLYDNAELELEKQYVLKKLGIDDNDFEKLMNLPVRSHFEFKTEQGYWETYFNIIKRFKLKKI